MRMRKIWGAFIPGASFWVRCCKWTCWPMTILGMVWPMMKVSIPVALYYVVEQVVMDLLKRSSLTTTLAIIGQRLFWRLCLTLVIPAVDIATAKHSTTTHFLRWSIGEPLLCWYRCRIWLLTKRPGCASTKHRPLWTVTGIGSILLSCLQDSSTQIGGR